LKQARKLVKWVSSAKRDLDAMPEDAKEIFGHAIDLAQTGGKHQDAKVMTGFGSASVLDVVQDHHGNTFRAVHTVKLAVGFMSCTASRRSLEVTLPHPNRTWI
jgi:phage-related protein